MDSSLERLFTFLFKYPPRVFQRGEFLLAPAVPVVVLAALLAVVILLVVVMTRRLRVNHAPDRVVLGAIRIAILLLVGGCLLRPTLALSSAVAQRNVLAILLDDSRSMQVKDVAGSRRLDAEQRTFADSTALVQQLAKRFALRFFRFGADASPVASAAALAGAGTRTDLGAAITTARQELADLPVAGMVVVSDGADNGTTDLAGPLLLLKTRHIPVYTVGIGQERFDKDLAVDRVALPPTTLAGAGTSGTVTLTVRGLSGDSTNVAIEADGRLVGSAGVRLPRGREVVDVPLRIPALAVGTHVIGIRVTPLAGEVVTENNEAQALLRVRAGREKILLVEGTPRPEFAFLRRGVADDSALQLVGLLRSAKGKFLRVGVDDSLELLAGFPSRRADLYRYQVIVLGDIEASFFTGDQLRMLADFVDHRGGALIALGGRSALGEGGYRGTLFAETLPFDLEGGSRKPGDSMVTLVDPVLTPAGRAHPALQLAPTEELSQRRWDSLPPLTAVNQLGTLRPGATLLIDGKTKGGGRQPMLAFQHYGRGVSAVLGVQDSWLWKMDPRTPIDDRTFETFWRQLLRWMLDQTAERIEIAAEPHHVGLGEPVAIRARVSDSIYMDVNDAMVTAQVKAPTGRTIEVPLEWTLRDDGSYAGHFTPDEEGTWSLTAVATKGRDTTRSAPGALLVDPRGADMDRVELRTPVLRRLAEETGGKYYPVERLSPLADDVVLANSGITARESRDLWDMPIVLFTLILLLGVEWGYRRWRGLA